MNRSTDNPPPRRLLRPALIAAAAVAALGAGFAVLAYAADPRLDEADQALQKADALLAASSSAGASPKVEKEFAHHVDRARELIARARAHVEAAKTAVDEDLGLTSASAARSGAPASQAGPHVRPVRMVGGGWLTGAEIQSPVAP
ncbi:MAG: hypothetical protein ACRDKX_03715 [Solirubrobacterales bacterium]